MKKILMLVVAAMSLSFVACDGSKKTTEETTTEETATAADEVAEAKGDFLSQYEDFVNKAIPLVEKMKSGDAEAGQEYAKLAQELATFTQENQEAIANMSAEDVQKFSELGQKLAEAAQ